MNDQFETEVEAMLADQAGVEPATLARARASIADLPARGTSWSARLSAQWRRLWDTRSPVLSLAAVVALLVVIVAVSVVGRWQTGPAAVRSATPAVESPSVTNGCAATGPARTAVLSASQSFLYTDQALNMLGWAPDGSSFAVSERPRASSPQTMTVHFFSRAGAAEGSVEATAFGWLAGGNYLILRPQQPPDALQSQLAYLGKVGSTELTAMPGTYESAGIFAGPGVAALYVFPSEQPTPAASIAAPGGTPSAVPPLDQYVVVSSNGTVSAPREGVPGAWSRDGKNLVVYRQPGFDPVSWLEVVQTSTGKSVLAPRNVGDARRALFSPDGARLAFDYPDDATQGRIGVVDVASGRLSTIPDSGDFTWAGNDELLIQLGPAPGQIVSWLATTGELTPYGRGTTVAASGSGLVITGGNCANDLSVVERLNGRVVELGALDLGLWPLPDFAISESDWSPDGRSLVIVVGETAEHAVLIHF